MNQSEFIEAIKRMAFIVYASFIAFSCDPSGNDGDDPLPKDPIEDAKPETLIPTSEIRILTLGNADDIGIFTVEGKNLALLSGNGEYSLKFSIDPERFKDPSAIGETYNALNFPAKPDTLWLFQNEILKNTFLLKEGKNQYGIPYSYGFENKRSDMAKVVRELQEKSFSILKN